MKTEEIKITFEGEITSEQILVAFETLFSEKEISEMWLEAYNNYLKVCQKRKKSKIS